jgi:hypothetical protein
LVPPCLMWTLWQERDLRTFEDMQNPTGRIIEVFMGSSFDWSRARGFHFSPSLGIFLDSLDFSHTVNSL